MPTQSTKARGTEFEALVARYYEALGYRVERDVNLGNHQIDIVARRGVEGASDLCLAIDAKSRTSKSVGINDITAFLAIIRDLHARNLISSGVMVTDRNFTQDARGAAQGIPLLRLARLVDLEEELLIGSAFLHKAKGDLERTPAQRSYVPLLGTLHHRSRKQELADICRFMENWVRQSNGLLIVLGDFGSGKTTLIERLFIEVANARQKEELKLYPILLRLRSFRQYVELWDFIAANLQDNQYVATSKGLFFDRLRSGDLLILLDGFDEIHTGANAEERGAYLSRLAPLLQSPSPCIIASRPTYFESRHEMVSSFNRHLLSAPTIARVPPLTRSGANLREQLASLGASLGLGAAHRMTQDALSQFVDVGGFSPEQIEKFVEKRESELRAKTGMSAKAVLETLYSVYHVDDLMTRPLLLTMIVELVIGGALDLKDKAQSLGPSSIYEISTQFALSRDITKRGPENQFLKLAERAEVCRQLALKMLEKERVELNASDVTQAIRNANLAVMMKATGSDMAGIIERIETDVRVGSFLKFTDEGAFRFTHKSYFEFFVAQHVHLALEHPREHVRPPFSKLTWEIVYFLASYVRDLPNFAEMVQAALRSVDGYDQGQRNCFARVAFAAGLQVGAIREVAVENILVRAAQIRSVDLKRVVFSKVNIADCSIVHWRSKDLVLQDTSISNTTLADCNLDIRGSNVRLENCMISSSRLNLTDGSWLISDVMVGKSTLSFEGKFVISNVEAEDCFLTFQADDNQAWSSLVARRSRLRGPLGKAWLSSSAGSRLEDCLISGMALSDLETTELLRQVADEGRTWLDGCKGVLLLSGFDEMATEPILMSLRLRLPRLTIASVEQFNDAMQRLRARRRAAAKDGADDEPMPIADAIKLFKNVKLPRCAEIFATMHKERWLEDDSFSLWRRLVTVEHD